MIHSVSGFGRIGVFLPDAGYPAGLFGMSCRRVRLFLVGYRISGQIVWHCQVSGPCLYSIDMFLSNINLFINFTKNVIGWRLSPWEMFPCLFNPSKAIVYLIHYSYLFAILATCIHQVSMIRLYLYILHRYVYLHFMPCKYILWIYFY